LSKKCTNRIFIMLQLLAEAIRSVTEMNPDLSVERIECMRQIEQVEK
jgi:hypothetical protein